MSWNPRDTVNLRLEFVQLALPEGGNHRELCRRFGISPKAGYKWLKAQALPRGWCGRPRRPLAPPAVEPHPYVA
jgi:transposase-like protein